jgi:hypothetical protein
MLRRCQHFAAAPDLDVTAMFQQPRLSPNSSRMVAFSFLLSAIILDTPSGSMVGLVSPVPRQAPAVGA